MKPLFVIALVLVGCNANDSGGGAAKRDAARTAVGTYAFEAYAAWMAANPDRECPTLTDLDPLLRTKPTTDPWGHPYVALCKPDVPNHNVFGVYSLGPDGKKGTADDVTSWLGPPVGSGS